jgi:hypothetical protein
VVERLLAKEKIGGPNPLARSGSAPETGRIHPATSPSGKARVCKTLTVGSNPTVASTKSDPTGCSFFIDHRINPFFEKKKRRFKTGAFFILLSLKKS